jgi:pimeloyl-ACP methyl ester carboxylesterase
MPTVRTTDGVTLSFTDEGQGQPVVLVAGFTAPATTWGDQARALLDAGYRVVAVDRRSHGLSESPAFGQRMGRHGKDIDEVLAALNLTDAVLVGGSMGASASWAYCDLVGSARLRGMVSVDQTPKMVNGDGWEHGFYGLPHENSGTFFDAGIPMTGRGFTDEQATPGIMRMLESAGPGGLPGVQPETAPLLRDHAQPDWRDVVARLDVPVLMVAGRHSQYWPCEHAAAAVAGNPSGRAVVLEDCGHAANLDRPDEFNGVLLGFLRDL